MSLEEFTVFQEPANEAWLATYRLSGSPGLAADRVQILADKVGHGGARQMAPEVLHRVQLWCVCREVFHLQPSTIPLQIRLYLLPAMRRQAIPQQEGLLPPEVTLHDPQVRQQLGLLHRSRL